jgi:NADPH:quinone reductase-like Zn-dependent oxidoreductase
MPRNLSFEATAAVPIAGQTALQGLRDIGSVQPGHRVLIIGAAGGVGTFAVQIAKVLGAEVTAVCATNGLELVASLGADHVVDYTEQDLTEQSARYDVIYQGAGAHSITELRGALTDSGTLVLSSGEGGRWFGPLGRLAKAMAISPFVSHDLRTFVATSNTDDLSYLNELAEAGQLTPVIDRTYPLAEMADAVRHFLHGHGQGKIVVTI